MKPKILIISDIIPSKSGGGGRLAMHRHFVLNQDFNVAVASYNAEDISVTKFLLLQHSNLYYRMCNSRFTFSWLKRLAKNFSYLSPWCKLPKNLINFAEDFKPDFIFSVADLQSTGFAFQLSQKMNTPLITNFQDIFPLSNFVSKDSHPYNFTKKILLKKYHLLNSKSAHVFHTSEGMQKWFPKTAHSSVLYPLGEKFENTELISEGTEQKIKHLIYAGNCYHSYGKMILELAQKLKNHSNIKLSIFASGNDWTEEVKTEFIEAAIYKGFMPFSELRSHLSNADAYITVMSFDDEDRTFMETSFTTKWLDYSPYGKPIFVWGPEYSSANIFAKKYSCAKVTQNESVDLLIKDIESVLIDNKDFVKLSENAKKVALDQLSHDKIHQHLKKTLLKIKADNAKKAPSI